MEFWNPVLLSLRITLVASFIVMLLGVVAAWRLSTRKFRGKTLLETFFMLPLVLPPTVVGFILLMLFGRTSSVGRFIEAVLGHPLVFHWTGAVLTAVIVSFPLVYQTLKSGFNDVDPLVEQAARAEGANEWQVLRCITMPLAARSMATAYVLGFTRGIGEFGATLMVAGNIPNVSQTVPTAIYFAVDAGHTGKAWAWSGCMIAFSFLLLFAANRKSER
ncbi:molybdate ABC transporter permease subunit [Paenibacillus sp. UMB4589-SE434]|uniref:molybdate ABC transporter permease subunit n=1 Tax=Paenibacillus sp. UMB4589-SE434 TaxID=3046314 RepID=UPI00254C4D56|nr:molybdate ABC transporter permease subunit [Paenibacillus sp. UMB4589-SE434]MDK8182675.1 molybdate ABC transporter permease subunit [Paenibacillus sp. UMB4589-SE434]